MIRTILCAALLATTLAAEKPALVLERLSDLDFGSVVEAETGGSLTLDPEGGAPRAQGLVPGSGACHPARFHLQGPPLTPFTLGFASETLGGRAGARVGRFQAGRSLAFDGAGRALVQVGATLELPAGVGTGPLLPGMALLTLRCPGLASVSVPFAVRGRVLASLKAEERAALDFGRLLAPETEGWLRLEPTGATWPAGGGRVATLKPGSPGCFQVLGEDGAQVQVQLPRAATLHGPGGALELTGFSSDADDDRLVLRGGRAELRIGATLKVPARVPPGNYQGTYQVTFVYQ
jgi:hypothetical protein